MLLFLLSDVEHVGILIHKFMTSKVSDNPVLLLAIVVQRCTY